MNPRRPRTLVPTLAVVLIGAALTGCGTGGESSGEETFVMRATWGPVPGAVEELRGWVVHSEGTDPEPGIARAVRCSLRRDGFTAQLQETFGALLPRRVRFRLHDRAAGRTWQTPWREHPDADRPEDVRTGRATWTVDLRAPGLEPGPGRERRGGDCRAELQHWLPTG